MPFGTNRVLYLILEWTRTRGTILFFCWLLMKDRILVRKVLCLIYTRSEKWIILCWKGLILDLLCSSSCEQCKADIFGTNMSTLDNSFTISSPTHSSEMVLESSQFSVATLNVFLSSIIIKKLEIPLRWVINNTSQYVWYG